VLRSVVRGEQKGSESKRCVRRGSVVEKVLQSRMAFWLRSFA